MVNDILYNIFVQYYCIKSVQKQGRNTEKSTKYAIGSLNNGDFSREMAFFEHVLGGVLYPPPYYYSILRLLREY